MTGVTIIIILAISLAFVLVSVFVFYRRNKCRFIFGMYWWESLFLKIGIENTYCWNVFLYFHSIFHGIIYIWIFWIVLHCNTVTTSTCLWKRKFGLKYCWVSFSHTWKFTIQIQIIMIVLLFFCQQFNILKFNTPLGIRDHIAYKWATIFPQILWNSKPQTQVLGWGSNGHITNMNYIFIKTSSSLLDI